MNTSRSLTEDCIAELEVQNSSRDFSKLNIKKWDQLIGAWYLVGDSFDKRPFEKSLPGQFLLALAHADLIDGLLTEIERSDAKALELLVHVRQADPRNSAPYLFAALIEERAGESERAQDLIHQAQSTDYFNSYIQDISTAIFSDVRSPSDLIHALSILANAPFPRFAELRDFLLTKDSTHFARQMMKQGLDNDAVLDDVEWLAIEYAVGHSIMKNKNPATEYPSYRELAQQKDLRSPSSSERFFKLLKARCDLDALDPIIRDLEKRLSSNMRKD